MERRTEWPLAKKLLACLLALTLGMMFPVPRQQAAASEGMQAARPDAQLLDDGEGGGDSDAGEGTGEGEGDSDATSGVYTDRIGIKWNWNLNDDGTVNISGRGTAPEEDGLNWIIPSEINGRTVTTMIGSTMPAGNWFFNGGNANSITFPETLRDFGDTWGQSFLTSNCFSGYSGDKRVFFLGDCPDNLNWQARVSSSDLRMKIYVQPQYIEKWRASLPEEWKNTTFEAYTPPKEIYAANSDGSKLTSVDIPVNGGVLVNMVTLPKTDTQYYWGHSKMSWTSSNPHVSVWNENGWVYALSNALEGETATITVENGLYQSYRFTVRVVPKVEDPTAKDVNGVSWYYKDLGNDEVSISGIVNKSSYAGKDLIVPSKLAGKKVTRIYGRDYYSSEEAVFEGLEAHSVTFPASIEYIDDTSTRFFYNMVQYDNGYRGKIFFLGAPPEMDWDSVVAGSRGPSGLCVRSIQEWKSAGCPWYGQYAYEIREYAGPEGVAIENGGAAARSLTLPLGVSQKLTAKATPASDAYYQAHTKVSWSSSDPSKVDVSYDGTVTAGRSAQAGDKATITATSALGYTATCEVTVGPAPEKADIGAACKVSLKDWFKVNYPGAGNIANYPEYTVTPLENPSATLELGVDYTVAYQDSNGTALTSQPYRTGTYKMVISGAGPWYKGEITLNYTITTDIVPIAGWTYKVDSSTNTATLEGYEGDPVGTLVVPASIGGKRVTTIADRAIANVTGTLVVPDSVTQFGDQSSADFGKVRFMGEAPRGFTADKLPTDAKVEAFKAHRSSFGQILTTEPSVGWKYYLSLNMKGAKTGYLGSSAAAPTSGCQMGLEADKDYKLPEAIDGVVLSALGDYAVAYVGTDGGELDCDIVRVPASYTRIGSHVFDHLNAVVVFAGAAPTKTGADPIAIASRTGLPDPEILWPQGAEGWSTAVAGWAKDFNRGSYNPLYRFTFGTDSVGNRSVYLTGYDGAAAGTWQYPNGEELSPTQCMIDYQTFGGFKDSKIDATNLTQITMPNSIRRIEGTAFVNLECDEIFFDWLYGGTPPIASDYAKAFLGPDGKTYRGAIAVTAQNYDAWKASEWGKYYTIKIHMANDPKLFDYEEVEGGLAVTGYHGTETSIAVPSFVDGVTQDGKTYSGEVVAIGDSAFAQSSVSAVDIPGSVRTVGNYAFQNKGLTYVNLQEGVERLGTWCFWSCSLLKEITLPASLKSLGEAPFGVSGIENVKVNEGSKYFKSDDGVLFTADGKKLVFYPLERSDSTYEVPQGTEAIGKFAFRGAADMYVDAYALEKVVLPEGLTEIEPYAFQQHDELVDINLPSTLSSLGKYAFQSCTHLKEISIPGGVTQIPEGFLEFCESVAELDVPGSVAAIDEDAFFSMGSLRKVTLHEGLRKIGPSAFNADSSLQEINFPQSLEVVGGSAFLGDTQLSKLDLGKTKLVSIGAGAFAGLEKVSGTLVLPTTLKEIGTSAFTGMHNVKQVEFAKPTSLTELSDGVFSNMSGLEWITIPAEIQKVGAGLFYDTAVKRNEVDSKFHVVFLNKGKWECDDDKTTFSHMYDTIQQGYVYGYESSSTLENISDANGDVFPGLVWCPIDVTIDTDWGDVIETIPGDQVRLVANATTKNGELSYEWAVDGKTVPSVTGNVFQRAFDEAGNHTVSVKVYNSFDPENPTLHSTMVQVHGSSDVKLSIERAQIAAIPDQVFAGTPVTPELTVTYNGIKLAKGADYKVDYANNSAVGTATAYVTGIGKYKGTTSKTFEITGVTASSLSAAVAQAKVDRASVVASDDGAGLKAGTVYAPKSVCAALDDAINAAATTAFAANPTQAQLVAAAQKLQQAQAAFDAAKKTATGSEKAAAPATATTGSSTTTGSGAASGSATTPSKAAAAAKASIAKAKVTAKAQVYTGKALKPAPTVRLAGKTLRRGVDYTVSYRGNKAVGTATVTVKGKGSYTGTASGTFAVNPKAPKAARASGSPRAVKLTWKAAAGAGGYQVAVATNKAFTSGKRYATAAGAKAASKKVAGLKAGKKYYAKVRAFKKVGKKTYYSAWSGVKTAKTPAAKAN